MSFYTLTEEEYKIGPLYPKETSIIIAGSKFAFCYQNIYRYVNEIPSNIII